MSAYLTTVIFKAGKIDVSLSLAELKLISEGEFVVDRNFALRAFEYSEEVVRRGSGDDYERTLVYSNHTTERDHRRDTPTRLDLDFFGVLTLGSGLNQVKLAYDSEVMVLSCQHRPGFLLVSRSALPQPGLSRPLVPVLGHRQPVTDARHFHYDDEETRMEPYLPEYQEISNLLQFPMDL